MVLTINSDHFSYTAAIDWFFRRGGKIAKPTSSLVTSVCLSGFPSVNVAFPIEQLHCHWTDFQEI
jgi:hypothetical protein